MDDIWTRPSGLLIRRVSGAVFRSGQPKDLADWEFMRDSLGIDTVVKLNTESEGTDNGARALGLTVNDYPIPPIGDGNILQEVAGIFEKPDFGKLEDALEVAAAGKCLIHCSHGEDRSGLVCGLYRVRYDGWSTQQAWDEMIALGYHPEFIGLDKAWWMENSAGRGV